MASPLGRPRKNAFSSPKTAIEPLESRRYLTGCAYYVSPAGNDANPGTSASPFATLQEAADTVQPGDTVNVLPGHYAGFQLATSGTATAPITFSAQSGVVIDGAPATSNGAIDVSSCNYVTLQGFTIDPAAGQTYRACIWGGGEANHNVNGLVIEDNTCQYGDWWGILLGYTNNSRIINNTCGFTQVQHGIYLGNSSINDVIAGNTCFDNQGCGIEVNADATQGGTGISTNITIEDNTLYDNALAQGAEINFDGVQNSLIANNLIYGGQRNGIALYQYNGADPSTGNRIVNNTIDIDSNPTSGGYAAVSILDGSADCTIFNNIFNSKENTLNIDPASQVGLRSDYNLFGPSEIDPTGANTYDGADDLAQWQALGFDAHSTEAADIAGQFVNPTTTPGNFQLLASSSAIGTGVGTFNGISAPATDLVGTSRAARVDLGAIEYTGVVLPQINATAAGTSATAVNLSWTTNIANPSFTIEELENGVYDTIGTTLAERFSVGGLSAFTPYTFEVVDQTTASGAIHVTTLPTAVDSLWNESASPANINSGDARAVELGVQFQSGQAGYITGIRFYKSAQNIGAHTGSLWSANGALLATATFVDESASGWEQVNFSNPVAIAADTTYVASYHTFAGEYSYDSDYFATSFTSGPLTALAAGATSGGSTSGGSGSGGSTSGGASTAGASTAGAVAGNGVYLYGGGGVMPNQSYNATNYWVDPVFTGATVQQSVGPTPPFPRNPTGGGGSTNSGGSGNATTPKTPTDLKAVVLSDTSIALSWIDDGNRSGNGSGGGQTGFEILASAGGGGYKKIGAVGATATKFTATGLKPSTTYSFEIIATGAKKNAAPTKPVTAKTFAKPAPVPPKPPVVKPPSAPTNLKATASTASTVDLAWTKPAGDVTSYEILLSVAGKPFKKAGIVVSRYKTLTVTHLLPSTNYEFEVIAIGPGGTSKTSNILTIKTKPAPAAAGGVGAKTSG